MRIALGVPESLKSWLGVEMDEVSLRDKILSAVGGLVSVMLVLGVCEWAVGRPELLVLVPSMGASAVLLFAMPHAPLSQPWPVIGGHVCSALAGVACAKLIPFLPLAAGCAVGLAIALMHILKCIHPPGGGTALIAVIGGKGVTALGYSFVWFPVAINALLMVAVAVMFNLLFRWRRYPARLCYGKGESSEKMALSQDAVAQVVRSLDAFVDISEEDLLTLHRKLSEREGRKP